MKHWDLVASIMLSLFVVCLVVLGSRPYLVLILVDLDLVWIDHEFETNYAFPASTSASLASQPQQARNSRESFQSVPI